MTTANVKDVADHHLARWSKIHRARRDAHDVGTMKAYRHAMHRMGNLLDNQTIGWVHVDEHQAIAVRRFR